MEQFDSIAAQMKELLRDMTELVDKIALHASAMRAMEHSLLRENVQEKLDALDAALSNIDDARADINSAKDDLESHHTDAEIASQQIRKLLK